MIPVSDAVRSRTFPFVNVAAIAACLVVFVYELSLSTADLERFFYDYGVVPAEIHEWAKDPSGLEQPGTVVSAAFIHGGWLHLLGNMIYLWVFGDNIEDALGHLKYAAFYLVAAAGAVVLQVAMNPDETVPMIGASGAIAGVLGAYLVLYPRATVSAVIPPIWFLGAFPVPAVVLIGIWFVMQLFIGIASLGADTVAQGVAVWAHVGGFLTGFAIVLLARPLIRVRPLPPRRRRMEDV